MRLLKIFAILFGLGFSVAAAGYYLLALVMPGGHVFAGLFRMFPYHEQHPYQYIAVATFTYAVFATACTLFLPKQSGWRRPAMIVGVMLGSILVASIPGGILWHIHDMQAGFFPKGAHFWNKLADGVEGGLSVGWLVISLSMPYNLLGLAFGYWLTSYAFRIAQHEKFAHEIRENCA